MVSTMASFTAGCCNKRTLSCVRPLTTLMDSLSPSGVVGFDTPFFTLDGEGNATVSGKSYVSK